MLTLKELSEKRFYYAYITIILVCLLHMSFNIGYNRGKETERKDYIDFSRNDEVLELLVNCDSNSNQDIGSIIDKAVKIGSLTGLNVYISVVCKVKTHNIRSVM